MPSTPVSDLKSKVLDLLNEAGLSRISGTIEGCIKDSLILKTKRVDDNAIPLGKTKMGGAPDLPLELEWPTWHGEPLSFIAQVNLAELPHSDFLNVLPSSGTLYFFYAAKQGTSGGDPKDKGSWRVLFEDVSDLYRRQLPESLSEECQYLSCSVEILHSITIPNGYPPPIKNVTLSDDEDTHYIDFSMAVGKALRGPDVGKHRILGHPDRIQGDMQVECQLLSNGLNFEDGIDLDDPKVVALTADAERWELLLQVDTDYEAGMQWCGTGTLYFWIPRDELDRRNFEATWMLMQCD
jgi:uncharacterized protein YwqG